MADTARSRLLKDTSTNSTMVVTYHYVNHPSDTTVSTQFATGSEYLLINDTITPNYRSRINAGEIINNECSINGQSVVTQDGSYVFDNGVPGDGYVHGSLSGALLERWLGPVAHVSTPDTATLISDAKVRALANVDPSEFSFGEDLGEALFMLKDLKKTLPRIIRKLKEWRRKRDRINRDSSLKPLERSRALAGLWLQYRFFIAPLFRSASDAVEAYYSTTPEDPKRLTARGFSSMTKQYSSTGALTHVEHTTETDYGFSARAYIIYTGFSPVSVNRKLGLRWSDVPETVWQLLPLSFMVDRVINISHAIRALTNVTNPSINMLAAGVVTKTLTTTTRRGKMLDNGTISRTGDPGIQSLVNDVYARTVWKPNIFDVVPEWHPGQLVDDAVKVTDLLALILTLTKNDNKNV